MPPSKSTIPKAAEPALYGGAFDPWNSSSTGHQRAENNRLGLLPEVCAKFGELMSAARGEIEMTVTSATVRFSLFFGI